MLSSILEFLSPRDLCVISAVCRQLRKVSSSNSIWRPILRRDMPEWPAVAHNTQPGHHDAFFAAKKAFVFFISFNSAFSLRLLLRFLTCKILAWVTIVQRSSARSPTAALSLDPSSILSPHTACCDVWLRPRHWRRRTGSYSIFGSLL